MDSSTFIKQQLLQKQKERKLIHAQIATLEKNLAKVLRKEAWEPNKRALKQIGAKLEIGDLRLGGSYVSGYRSFTLKANSLTMDVQVWLYERKSNAGLENELKIQVWADGENSPNLMCSERIIRLPYQEPTSKQLKQAIAPVLIELIKARIKRGVK